jgi:hypothetical protein
MAEAAHGRQDWTEAQWQRDVTGPELSGSYNGIALTPGDKISD